MTVELALLEKNIDTVESLDEWHNVKNELNNRTSYPIVKQREVWWCSIGVNVGDEENGKGERYTRPVLVIRKFNKRIFLGVPLSTQLKDKSYYHRIHFHNKEQSVMLSQMRLWDARRLTSRIGQVAQKQFEEIRVALKDLI